MQSSSLRILADTQVMVWYVSGDTQLSVEARMLLSTSSNQVHFSVESLREIAIKRALGRARFTFEPREVHDALLSLGWLCLSTTAEHVFALNELQLLHRDPFDRLLAAQAKVERLQLLTSDRQLQRYPVRTIPAR